MSITLILGPMFSGKTKKLIETQRSIVATNITVKPALDTRYSETEVVAHSGERSRATALTNLEQIVPWVAGEPRGVGIFVDEGQFFADLAPSAVKLADEYGAHVFIAALNGTAERAAWPSVAELLPHVSEIIWCAGTKCGKCDCCDACFTKRLGKLTHEVDIGGADKYAAACRGCYNLKA
jgi:thymidine kinase